MAPFGIRMKSRYSIGFFAIGLFFLSSCSSTRYVPEGEYLLRKTQVNVNVPEDASWVQKMWARLIKSDPLPRTDFVNLQRQQANERLFWIPLRLHMYSSVDIEKDNWWPRVMKKSGEPPVIFDSVYANQTVQRMRQYLVNKGHFHGNVHYVSDTSKRKRQSMEVVYNINTGPGYRYRNVSIDVRDENLIDLFRDWSSRTLIKQGDPYDTEVLDDERLRIMQGLQNQGYYFFGRDHIEFWIDSALNAYLMDITLVVNPPKTGEHNEKYSFSEVFIFPNERPGNSNEKTFDTTLYTTPKSRGDTATQKFYFIHSEPLQVKPQVVASKLLIRPGEPYSLSNIERTYENLLDLRVFRATNITIQQQPKDINDPTKNLLNTTIEVQRAPTWATEANWDLTNTSGLHGTAVNAALRNRNLFGGAEIFSLQLRGLVEVQYLFNKEARIEQGLDVFNNFDIGVNLNLDIPRFIVPFNLQRVAQYRPRTLMNVGYSYQFRPEFYDRQIANFSFAYSWRQARTSHILFPIDLNWVQISLKPEFLNRYDTLLQNNERFRYQYSDHFIFAARYSFAYSGQLGNRPISFNAFRFSLESSGNSLYLIDQLTNAPKNENNQYQFFNLAYAQYIRVNADLKRYWYFNEDRLLVTRLMSGSGFAYGNSVVLPYEKGFFAGGSNNIRAWPMNMLGPGSYHDPDRLRMERIGDIALVGNVEYRFPFMGAFKGALFVDAGNIWLRNENEWFPKGDFSWTNVPNDLAVGAGFGLRWDLGFFVVRLDAAAPLRDPAKPDNEKWVVSKMQMRDFVLNFGIGYPF